MAKMIESYKISVRGGTVHRRETETGAMNLAEKMRRNGKHGMVEAVIFHDDNPEKSVEFIQIKKY